jgi:alkanesulfonate monooxygenase SsuD/methylene tetrahydromethanopterin reductase-like flavin-dependent oxidoreductase (luciferase family)
MLSANVPGPLLTAQAQHAEASGLAGVCAPEFYGNPMVPLAHCGAVTERIQLLTAVTLPLVHNPFTLAMSAMDLDRLSGGRFVLGVGPSAPEMVEGFHGRTGEFDRPLARLREAIEVIRLIVAQSHTGALTRFDGEFFRHDWGKFQGSHLPPLRPQIPIWIAATQLGLVRLAAEVADGLTTHPIWSVDWAVREGEPALAAALKEAGRHRSDIQWNAGFFVAVTDDTDLAIQDAKPTVALYAGVKMYEPYFEAQGFGAQARACQAATLKGDSAGAGAAAVTDEMAATFVVAGTAEECRRRLAPIGDRADSFLLVPPFLEVPLDRLMNYTFGLAEAFYA